MTESRFPIGADNWVHNTDEEIVGYIRFLRQSAADLQAHLGRLELLLIQRLEKRKARELQHPTLQVFLEYRTPQYDPAKLAPLAELVPPEDWAKAWHPGTTRHVPVPAGLDMRIAGGWGKRFGVDVAAVITAAQLPNTPRLVIKDKPGANKQATKEQEEV